MKRETKLSIWCEEAKQYLPLYKEINGLRYELDTETLTYLPKLEIETPQAELGRFGSMRLKYLEQHKQAEWLELIWTDQLYSHCIQMEKDVQNQIEQIVEQKIKSKEFQTAMYDFMKTYQLRQQYQTEAEEQAIQSIYI